MVLGEHGLQSGEGRSRSDIGFRCSARIMEAIYVNPNIVLVLNNGHY
jgi:beta-glucosidase